MRIGIDAKWFFKGPASGKVVIQNLVEKLFAINSEHEIYLFLDKEEEHRPFPYKKETIHLEYIWAKNNLFSNLFAIPRRANKLDLDAVIFQTFPSFIGKFKKVAFIHDVLFLSHPYFYTLWERLYFSPLRFLSKHSDLVCTVSEEEKNRLIKYAYQPKNGHIQVIYHGVASIFKPKKFWDTQQLEAVRSKFNLPEKYILFVGRLNIRKNIINLVKALPLLTDQSIPLVIVGAEDWKTSDLETQIQELNIVHRTILTGAIYGSELAAVYSLATIFCFPSQAESFGLPALEAMASGVPTVVSNSTSLPEICGQAGTYVDPNSPATIALAIDTLLVDDNLLAFKSSLGLVRAEFFTWDKSAEQLLESTVRLFDQ